MRMSQMERRLGVTLLQRGPAGTRLTPAGRQIAALGRRVLTAAEAMMDGVAAVVAAEGPGLRVAASLTVAEHLLPGWISALHEESPDVVLAVEVTNSSKVLARIDSGGAEVGFRHRRAPEPPSGSRCGCRWRCGRHLLHFPAGAASAT